LGFFFKEEDVSDSLFEVSSTLAVASSEI